MTRGKRPRGPFNKRHNNEMNMSAEKCETQIPFTLSQSGVSTLEEFRSMCELWTVMCAREKCAFARVQVGVVFTDSTTAFETPAGNDMGNVCQSKCPVSGSDIDGLHRIMGCHFLLFRTRSRRIPVCVHLLGLMPSFQSQTSQARGPFADAESAVTVSKRVMLSMMVDSADWESSRSSRRGLTEACAWKQAVGTS